MFCETELRCVRVVSCVDMREAFNLFDKDKDGRITCSELLTVMKELRQQTSEDEIKDMITHADADGKYLVSKFQALLPRPR